MSERDTHHHTVDDDWPSLSPELLGNAVLESYVGSYVKLRFVGRDERGEEGTEDLWVAVTGVMGHELVGEIENVPALEMEYACGEFVGFELHEIKRIVKPGDPITKWSSWRLDN